MWGYPPAAQRPGGEPDNRAQHKKLPTQSPHRSHHCLVDNLWATCLHCLPPSTVPCTTNCDPQSLHTNHTGVPTSSTTHIAPPTGLTPHCPQHAQALILLLRSLRSFFFEKTSGDGRVPNPCTATSMTRESLDRLAFKMASEALRLWFDFRFGCRDGLRGQAFVTGEYPIPRGMVQRMDLAWLVRSYEGTLWTWRRPKSA
jgi:hypothetical protein